MIALQVLSLLSVQGCGAVMGMDNFEPFDRMRDF